jgi:hypothetical protein
MRRFVLFTLLAGLAVVPLARADEWSKTYVVTGAPELRIETSDANLHVDTWDQNMIEARVSTDRYKINGPDLKVYEHQNGNSVEIEVRFPARMINFNFHERKVEVVIHMPREGRLNLKTGDGMIEVSRLKGQMDLQTGDGHQEIRDVDGNLRARSGDGHIEAAGRFDALELNTGDGHIDARAQAGSTVASSWTIRTGDGSVTLRLPETLAANIDLRTSDGSVTADMPVAVEGKLGEKQIHGKINGGGNLITVHTGDGSIHLQKL